MTLLFFIMTLLCHTFFCISPDYSFSLFHFPQKDYYFAYDISIISLFYLQLQLSHYYLHYFYIKLLLLLSFLKPIIWIILFSQHYLHYCNYRHRIIDITDISGIIAIKYIWSLLLIKVEYAYRYWV